MRLTASMILIAALLGVSQAYAELKAPDNPVKTFEQDRLTEIESGNDLRDKQIYGIRTMQPAAWNTLLESRIKAIEGKLSASNNNSQPIDTSSCKDLKANVSKGNTLLCPAGQVVVGFSSENGKLSSARCCPLK